MSGAAGGGRAPGILFRCDGSPSIGMGHVVRCSALALALKKRGCPVGLVMRDLPGNAGDFVRRAGLPVEMIAYPSSAQEASLTEQDLDGTVETAKRWRAGCVVVDHYGASSDYLGRMKASGVRVAVIDDLADRDLAPADWLLNQNLGAAGLAYGVRPDCVRLLGPAYALLRPEFGVMRGHLSRKFGPEDRRVLLTLGGGETAQLCTEVMEALNDVPGLDVRCALGGEDAASMAELMAWADLSINGGGSTCWELCCLGVPMVILTLAPDQALNASALERQRCALSLGEWRAGTGARRLAVCVKELLADPERRAAMSRAAQALVDGSGAERAADLLLESMA